MGEREREEIEMEKQIASRKLKVGGGKPTWQNRCSERKGPTCVP